MSEYSVHKAVASYITMQHPKVIFTSDSSGIRLSIGNALKMLALKSKDKIPDMIILQPKGNYKALIIEIKAKDKNPFLKDGSISKSKHVQAQYQTLQKLNKIGYKAVFGVGFDHCKYIIEEYFKIK